MKNKKVIRLSEADLHLIVTEAMKTVLRKDISDNSIKNDILNLLNAISNNLLELENITYNDMENCSEEFISTFEDIQYGIQGMTPSN